MNHLPLREKSVTIINPLEKLSSDLMNHVAFFFLFYDNKPIFFCCNYLIYNQVSSIVTTYLHFSPDKCFFIKGNKIELFLISI